MGNDKWIAVVIIFVVFFFAISYFDYSFLRSVELAFSQKLVGTTLLTVISSFIVR